MDIIAIKKDLRAVYRVCRDTQVLFKGAMIDAIFDESYEVNGIRERVIRVQSDDVETLTNSDIINIDGVDYKVISFQKSNNSLETVIGLER